jgi:hypothetical protein
LFDEVPNTEWDKRVDFLQSPVSLLLCLDCAWTVPSSYPPERAKEGHATPDFFTDILEVSTPFIPKKLLE